MLRAALSIVFRAEVACSFFKLSLRLSRCTRCLETVGGDIKELGKEVVRKINYDNDYHLEFRLVQRGDVAREVVTEKSERFRQTLDPVPPLRGLNSTR
jgi:hypothetical protein